MKLSLYLLAFFISLPILPIIVEHNEFCALLSYITPDDHHPHTCILLDIDNTLAHPESFIGTDQWATYEINKKINQGYSYEEALWEVLQLYFKIQHVIDLIPVESITVSIVKQLQECGITVLALTSRSHEISDRTILQLASMGIDFSYSAFGNEEVLGILDCNYLYKNGIIFCSNNDKGKVFKEIINYFNHAARKVIFVDDKEKYLHSVQAILEPHIEFIGIRYSHLDGKVAQFDPLVADQELCVLLSDYCK